MEASETGRASVERLLERPPPAVADLAYGELGIRVRASRPSDIRWLTEFLVPAFSRAGSAGPDVEVRLHADPAAFAAIREAGATGESVAAFALDSRLVEAPIWNGGGRFTVIFDREAGVFYLRSPDRSLYLVVSERERHSARGTVMRAVRELGMNSVASDGALLLHAAAAGAGGSAVAIAGPREAGKTTTLVSLLHGGSATYVSNDRVVLTADGDGVHLTGLPTFVSVRRGTLDLFPGLRRRLVDRGFHARFTVEEALRRREAPGVMDDGRYSLSPAQLCQLLDAAASRGGRAGAILFLAPLAGGETPEPGLRRLDIESAARRIAETRLGVRYGSTASEFFSDGSDSRGRSGASLDVRCDEIAARVPCFEWTALRGHPARGLLERLGEQVAPVGDAVASLR